MAAEQGHDGGAVMAECDDRRFGTFVGEQRRERADEDAGGHDADDAMPCGIELAQMSGCHGEADIGLDTGGQAVNFRAGQPFGQLAGERQPALVEDDESDHRIDSAARRTNTMEK